MAETCYSITISFEVIKNCKCDTNKLWFSGRGCGGKLFNYGGVFTSPLYPVNYRNNSQCRWDVSVPIGTIPLLKFTGEIDTISKLCILTPCRRATQKYVITVPCVVYESRISAFLRDVLHSHLVWLTYRFKVIASLMQVAWVYSYKQTDRSWIPIFRTTRLQQRHHSFDCSQRSGEKVT